MHNLLDWQNIIESINWTTVIASGVVAGIVSIFTSAAQFMTTRYLGKMLDRIEKDVQPKTKGKNDNRDSTCNPDTFHG